MEKNLIAVFVKADESGCITEVNSSAFLMTTEGWIQVDEGVGDRYHHAQGNYLPKPVYTEDGVPQYKLLDGVVVERTQEEICADRNAQPLPTPTEVEQLRADVDFLAVMTGVSL